ncbi:GNAT family N-acetyltransferase [Aestuariimicrobium kwangyangense]|uniref:GNAT family N-acetyltransferase n=1 Tax=Aestuariimicrobium kwangyangense TaxID=396389 RepID=UPI0012F75186|nr:GNAT family N-acetyltransferase [Aestuariimicrobium kwangyangense]
MSERHTMGLAGLGRGTVPPSEGPADGWNGRHMVRRISTLTPADLADLPSCPGDHLDVTVAELSWPRLAMDRLGMCGVAAHQSGEVVAYALVAPSFAVPEGHPLAAPPRTADAAALLALWVDDSYARLGWGRHLVQALTARLTGQVRCIEASAARTAPTCCEPSAEFLGAVGFVPTDLPRRHRIDLNRTVAVEPQWRKAMTRVAEWVQQPRPEPSGAGESHLGRQLDRA